MLLLICMQPFLAHAHPGKTDSYGGHTCNKGCEEWGLFYGEYHLHDKDGRPIRTGKIRKAGVPKRPLNAVPLSTMTESLAQERTLTTMPRAGVVTTKGIVNSFDDENSFELDPLLLILLLLLLLLLLLRLKRKREEA